MSGIGNARVVGPGDGRSFTIGADRVFVKGQAGDDDAGFSVIEYVGAPNTPGPPMHVHHTLEECWFILEGEVDFYLGQQQVARGKVGFFLPRTQWGCAYIPVLGSEPARWIGIFSPARYMALIEELGALIPPDGPPDPEKVLALFALYNTDIV